MNARAGCVGRVRAVPARLGGSTSALCMYLCLEEERQ